MATSHFASQYTRLRANHAKVKAAKADIHSLIDSCMGVDSLSEYKVMRESLRKALTHLATTIHDYDSSVANLRRKVDNMLSDTEERQDEQEKEMELFHKMRDCDDDDIGYNETSLTESVLPFMRSLVNETLSNAVIDVNHMTEMIAKKESINASSSMHPPTVAGIAHSTHPNVDPSPQYGVAQGDLTLAVSRITEQSNLAPLPPITLIPFDGESTHWEPFLSQYTHMIGSRSHLSKIEKLIYLRTALKGPAYRTVEGIPIGNEYLEATIDRLTTVYGRGKRSNAILINQLHSIKPKSQSMEDQLECAEKLINKVIQFSDQSVVDNFALIHQIAGAINPKHIDKMYEVEPSSMMEALTVIEADLREQIEIRNLKSTFCTTNRSDTHNQSNLRLKGQYDETANVASNAKPSLANTDALCVYCGKHRSSLCRTITSISERKNILKEKKLCFKCLSSQHMAINCDQNCQKCGKTHHESICDPGIPHSVITASVAYNTPVNPSH